jgi:hypothetical protein
MKKVNQNDTNYSQQFAQKQRQTQQQVSPPTESGLDAANKLESQYESMD